MRAASLPSSRLSAAASTLIRKPQLTARASLSRMILALFAVVAFLLPAAIEAQSFLPLGSLSFTKVYAGANPLPQVVTVTMPTQGTGGAFDFYASVVNGTGGTWLSIDLGTGYYATPGEMTVSVAPVVTLAPGTLHRVHRHQVLQQQQCDDDRARLAHH